jgi:CPA2 family monovalent cation:H+ antiporter-2
VSGVRGLLDVGADEVIPEEFEASVSIFACVLAKYALTGKEIDNLTKRIRAGGYRQFNRATAPGLSAAGQLTDESGGVRIHTVTVAPDSPAAGKTLRELDATARYGVGILAIRRRDATITSLPSELLLEPGDLLVLNATDEAFKKFRVVVLTKSPADEPGPT